MSLRRSSALLFALAASSWSPRAGAAGPFSFLPLTPCRIIDTRSGLGGYTGLLPNGQPGLKFTIKNAAPCNVGSATAAVAVNVTATDTQSGGWDALFPGDQAWNGTSSINFKAGDFIANGAVVPLGAGLTQDLAVLSSYAGPGAGSNLIVDVAGGFVPVGTAGSVSFFPVTPCRVVDTQLGLGGFSGLLPNGSPGTKFTVKGNCGVPTDAVAVAVTLSAVQTQAQGWFAIYPGNVVFSGVSNVNFFANDSISNGAIVAVSPGPGDLTVLAAYAGSSGAYMQLDVTGYFK